MRRFFVGCLALLAGLAFLPASPTLAATGSADWNQWGGNAGETWSNDAVTSISTSNAATLHLLWSHRFHLRYLALPAVVGDSIYTVMCCHRDYNQSNRLVRISLDPSGTTWKYGDGYSCLSGEPRVGQGIVVLYDSKCSASSPIGYRALHTRNGRQVWHADGFDNVLAGSRELIANGGGVYADPYSLTAYNQHDGTVDWTYGPLPSEHILFQPRAAGDAVYVAEGNSPTSLTALSATDGSFRWNVPGLVPFAATPDVVYGSEQYGFAMQSYGITALDPADGSVLWSRSGFDPFPRVAFSSSVDVVTAPNALVALDPSDGTTMWTLKGAFGQPTIANGVVYVPSSTPGVILVLDGSTGAQLTTIQGIEAAVVANGWVFTTTDHHLNAYAP